MLAHTKVTANWRLVLPVLLAVLGLIFALTPLANAGGGEPSQTATNMTEIELPDSPATSDTLANFSITTQPASRSGYLRAEVTDEQRRTLDAQGIVYDKIASFVLIEGGQLSGEGSVVGSNGTNVNILGNQTISSLANVSGAPSGKTVIRADLGVDIKYPAMCNIYIMAWHPSNVMWFHAWNGNQNPCTADLSKQWLGINDFNFADINGQWKLTVQETDGKTQGFLDYWFIRLYYEDNSTPTRTPTRTATATPIGGNGQHKVLLPIIISGF